MATLETAPVEHDGENALYTLPNPMEVPELIALVAEQLDSDSKSLASLCMVSRKCCEAAKLAFANSFESLNVVLSKKFLRRVLQPLAQHGNHVTRISVDAPSPDDDYGIDRAQELHDDLSMVLMHLQNLRMVEFASMTSLLDMTLWPGSVDNEYYYAAFLTALGNSNCPIEILSNDAELEDVGIEGNVQAYRRLLSTNRRSVLLYHGLPFTCFKEPVFTSNAPDWRIAFPALRKVTLLLGPEFEDIDYRDEVVPFFRDALRNVSCLHLKTNPRAKRYYGSNNFTRCLGLTVSYPNLKEVKVSGGCVESPGLLIGVIDRGTARLTHIEINGAGDHSGTLQSLIWFIERKLQDDEMFAETHPMLRSLKVTLRWKEIWMQKLFKSRCPDYNTSVWNFVDGKDEVAPWRGPRAFFESMIFDLTRLKDRIWQWEAPEVLPWDVDTEAIEDNGTSKDEENAGE